MEKDEDKVLVHCKLTRAERLTKIQLKESNIDENAKGLVVIEFNLSKQDLRKEYDEIMQASKQSGEDGFKKYIQYMRETLSYALNKRAEN